MLENFKLDSNDKDSYEEYLKTHNLIPEKDDDRYFPPEESIPPHY